VPLLGDDAPCEPCASSLEHSTPALVRAYRTLTRHGAKQSLPRWRLLLFGHDTVATATSVLGIPALEGCRSDTGLRPLRTDDTRSVMGQVGHFFCCEIKREQSTTAGAGKTPVLIDRLIVFHALALVVTAAWSTLLATPHHSVVCKSPSSR